MTGGHAHGGRSLTDGLLVHVDSPVHRLPAQVKVAAALLFVLTVVLLPRQQAWAPLLAAGALAVAVGAARVPPRVLAPRLVVELPFVLLAALLPFSAEGPRVDVAGIALSADGLLAAWNLVAKITLAGVTVLLLTATTPLRDLLAGMERLGLPRLLVLIASSMLRYADVLASELARMRVARLSRGDDPRWLWQARGAAATAGALFVRAYERGERVHLAMLSRGWSGTGPGAALAGGTNRATAAEWSCALALPAAGAGVGAAAWAAQAGVL